MTRVKVLLQRVQVVAEVQAWQLVIAVEQRAQVVGVFRYSFAAHEVQVVPLLPVLQSVQKVALSHCVQLKIAAEQGKQVEPLR